MNNTPTPHISAKLGEIAKTVLMPGDPLRAQYIAENYLTDVKKVSSVRNIYAFTGKYNGKEVSVMAHGIGMASIGLYTYELYNFYGVENIIRIGSAGGISDKVKMRDIVIALGASTDTDFDRQFHLPGKIAPIADYGLVNRAVSACEKLGISYHVGNMLSSNYFYMDYSEDITVWNKMNVLAVEMESAALYMNAARFGKKALCICTVTNHLLTGEGLSSDQIERDLNDMIKAGLLAATAE